MEKELIYAAISYVLAISVWAYLTISGQKGIENFKKVFRFIWNFFKSNLKIFMEIITNVFLFVSFILLYIVYLIRTAVEEIYDYFKGERFFVCGEIISIKKIGFVVNVFPASNQGQEEILCKSSNVLVVFSAKVKTKNKIIEVLNIKKTALKKGDHVKFCCFSCWYSSNKAYYADTHVI